MHTANLIKIEQRMMDAALQRVKPLYPELDIQNKLYRICPAAFTMFMMACEMATGKTFMGGTAASIGRCSLSYVVVGDAGNHKNADRFILETITCLKGESINPLMQKVVDQNRELFNAYAE